MGQIDKRLSELGITLPVPAKPVANYVGWVRTGNLVFTAGQVPLKDGKIEYHVPDSSADAQLRIRGRHEHAVRQVLDRKIR